MERSKEYQEATQLHQKHQSGQINREELNRYRLLRNKSLSIDEVVDFYMDVMGKTADEVKDIFIGVEKARRFQKAN